MWMDISTDKEHDVSVRVVDIGDWLNLVGVLNRSKQKLFVPSQKYLFVHGKYYAQGCQFLNIIWVFFLFFESGCFIF